jgi:hypothetical protein
MAVADLQRFLPISARKTAENLDRLHEKQETIS